MLGATSEPNEQEREQRVSRNKALTTQLTELLIGFYNQLSVRYPHPRLYCCFSFVVSVNKKPVRYYELRAFPCENWCSLMTKKSWVDQWREDALTIASFCYSSIVWLTIELLTKRRPLIVNLARMYTDYVCYYLLSDDAAV